MPRSRYPITKALILLILGIVLSGAAEPPLALTLSLTLLSFLVAWAAHSFHTWALSAAIVLLGVTVGEMAEPPHIERGIHEAIIRLDRPTSLREGELLGEATLCALRGDDGWQDVGCSVRFRCDSSLSAGEADLLHALFYVVPYDATSSSAFVRSISRQGFAAELRYCDGTLIALRTDDLTIGESLRHFSLSQLDALPLSGDSRAVVEAITTAHTSSLTPTLRDSYSLSGMSHLLAISGLHIGFVVLFALLLFRWVVLFRHGQILLSALVIVVVWLYAFMAGLQPSVLRATIMFSLFELLTLFSRRTPILERLSFAALLMLLFDASTLYDVGFQLSFVAVVAIVVWGTSWGRLWQKGSADESSPRRPSPLRRCLAWCCRWLWLSLSLSVAASVALLPLTSYYFGTLSLWSVITSPLMIPISGLVVCLGFVAIVLPVGAVSEPLAWLLDVSVGVMNDVAAWCSSHEWLVASWRCEGWQCAAMYGVMVVLTLAATHKK